MFKKLALAAVAATTLTVATLEMSTGAEARGHGRNGWHLHHRHHHKFMHHQHHGRWHWVCHKVRY